MCFPLKRGVFLKLSDWSGLWSWGLHTSPQFVDAGISELRQGHSNPVGPVGDMDVWDDDLHLTKGFEWVEATNCSYSISHISPNNFMRVLDRCNLWTSTRHKAPVSCKIVSVFVPAWFTKPLTQEYHDIEFVDPVAHLLVWQHGNVKFKSLSFKFSVCILWGTENHLPPTCSNSAEA